VKAQTKKKINLLLVSIYVFRYVFPSCRVLQLIDHDLGVNSDLTVFFVALVIKVFLLGYNKLYAVLAPLRFFTSMGKIGYIYRVEWPFFC